MTSLNGNIFRVTGPLRREFTEHRWIPPTKASDAELWCFLWTNDWVNNRDAGDLRRHRAHYDVTVMSSSHSCGMMINIYMLYFDKIEGINKRKAAHPGLIDRCGHSWCEAYNCIYVCLNRIFVCFLYKNSPELLTQLDSRVISSRVYMLLQCARLHIEADFEYDTLKCTFLGEDCCVLIKIYFIDFCSN